LYLCLAHAIGIASPKNNEVPPFTNRKAVQKRCLRRDTTAIPSMPSTIMAVEGISGTAAATVARKGRLGAALACKVAVPGARALAEKAHTNKATEPIDLNEYENIFKTNTPTRQHLSIKSCAHLGQIVMAATMKPVLKTQIHHTSVRFSPFTRHIDLRAFSI
jgi:hypothetical protein